MEQHPWVRSAGRTHRWRTFPPAPTHSTCAWPPPQPPVLPTTFLYPQLSSTLPFCCLLPHPQVLVVSDLHRSESAVDPSLFQYHQHFESPWQLVGKTSLSEVRLAVGAAAGRGWAAMEATGVRRRAHITATHAHVMLC